MIMDSHNYATTTRLYSYLDLIDWGVCVKAVTVARMYATALHLGKTSKSLRDSLEAITETIGLE